MFVKTRHFSKNKKRLNPLLHKGLKGLGRAFPYIILKYCFLFFVCRIKLCFYVNDNSKGERELGCRSGKRLEMEAKGEQSGNGFNIQADGWNNTILSML